MHLEFFLKDLMKGNVSSEAPHTCKHHQGDLPLTYELKLWPSKELSEPLGLLRFEKKKIGY